LVLYPRGTSRIAVDDLTNKVREALRAEGPDRGCQMQVWGKDLVLDRTIVDECLREMNPPVGKQPLERA
jgi:hypothetical protein